MVYVDPSELRWKPYVQTWLESKFPAAAKLSDATKVSAILRLLHAQVSI